MYLDGRPVLAHRFVVGAIDSDLHVMHLCDNPPCCNPAHLRLATQAENNADMMAKGRNGTNGYEKRTHCKHGHEYTPENTYRKKNGARNCKECVTISTRKRRAKGLR